MNKENAQKLMEIYNAIGSLLNEADPIIRQLGDENLRKQLQKPLGEVMADIWIKLERPIVKIFPELDPDKEPTTKRNN
jgi:hypothetical protein